jgi:acyl carrier protein
MNDVLGRVKAIIEEQLDIDMAAKAAELGVSIDALRFREDLEADSLDLVELIMAFEEEFGGEISDEEAMGITTVGEAVAYLEAHLAEPGG